MNVQIIRDYILKTASKKDFLEQELPGFGVHNPKLDKHYYMSPGEQWLYNMAPTDVQAMKYLKEKAIREAEEAKRNHEENERKKIEAVAQSQSPRLPKL